MLLPCTQEVNGLWYTSMFRVFCTNIMAEDVHLISLLGSWVSVVMARYTAGCVCDQLFIRVLDLVAPTRFPWVETFCTCLSGLTLERTQVLCGSGWGRKQKSETDLSGLCLVNIFSCCFRCPLLIPNSCSNSEKEEQSRRDHNTWYQTVLQGHCNQNSLVLA